MSRCARHRYKNLAFLQTFLPFFLSYRFWNKILKAQITPFINKFSTPILAMFAKLIAGVLTLCGRAQEKADDLKPIVSCNHGCASKRHGHADAEQMRAQEDERLFKVHGSWCNFKTQAKGWRICLATAVLLEPLKNEVRANLTLKAQERCLSLIHI